MRKGAGSYGHGVGIPLIDRSTPFVPGDVGNASTFDFPVLYRTVPGVTLERLIETGEETGVPDPSLSDLHFRAATRQRFTGLF